MTDSGQSVALPETEAARKLCTTDELVAYYALYLGAPFEADEIARAIPAAIDAIYTNRDGGGNMHSAGAAAAAAALQAARGLDGT